MDHETPLMVTFTDAQFGKPIQVDVDNIRKKTQKNFAGANRRFAYSAFVTTLHMNDSRKIRVQGSTADVENAIRQAREKRRSERPKAGDTLILPTGKRVHIHNVSEGMVDISPDQTKSPIPLKHFAPCKGGEGNLWELVGVSSTDYERF